MPYIRLHAASDVRMLPQMGAAGALTCVSQAEQVSFIIPTSHMWRLRRLSPSTPSRREQGECGYDAVEIPKRSFSCMVLISNRKRARFHSTHFLACVHERQFDRSRHGLLMGWKTAGKILALL